jgi:NTP pyrophosphatase (non-canonical NTP hydrolase)
MKTTTKGLPAGATLGQLQRYIEGEAKKRGFGDQTALQKCLILGEEVGELFKAVRKEEKMPIGAHSKVGTISEELADVLMYVCTIASFYGVDLEQAFRAKDKIHSKRVWH